MLNKAGQGVEAKKAPPPRPKITKEEHLKRAERFVREAFLHLHNDILTTKFIYTEEEYEQVWRMLDKYPMHMVFKDEAKKSEILKHIVEVKEKFKLAQAKLSETLDSSVRSDEYVKEYKYGADFSAWDKGRKKEEKTAVALYSLDAQLEIVEKILLDKMLLAQLASRLGLLQYFYNDQSPWVTNIKPFLEPLARDGSAFAGFVAMMDGVVKGCKDAREVNYRPASALHPITTISNPLGKVSGFLPGLQMTFKEIEGKLNVAKKAYLDATLDSSVSAEEKRVLQDQAVEAKGYILRVKKLKEVLAVRIRLMGIYARQHDYSVLKDLCGKDEKLDASKVELAHHLTRKEQETHKLAQELTVERKRLETTSSTAETLAHVLGKKQKMEGFVLQKLRGIILEAGADAGGEPLSDDKPLEMLAALKNLISTKEATVLSLRDQIADMQLGDQAKDLAIMSSLEKLKVKIAELGEIRNTLAALVSNFESVEEEPASPGVESPSEFMLCQRQLAQLLKVMSLQSEKIKELELKNCALTINNGQLSQVVKPLDFEKLLNASNTVTFGWSWYVIPSSAALMMGLLLQYKVAFAVALATSCTPAGLVAISFVVGFVLKMCLQYMLLQRSNTQMRSLIQDTMLSHAKAKPPMVEQSTTFMAQSQSAMWHRKPVSKSASIVSSEDKQVAEEVQGGAVAVTIHTQSMVAS